MYYTTLAVVMCTFGLIAYNFVDLKRHNEGTALMVERAAIIRSGAKAFLMREYRVIAIVVGVMAFGCSLTQDPWAGPCLLFGSILVLTGVEVGMRGGTYGNVRTTNAARVTKAISRTLRIATLSGSISGFAVPAFGMFGFTIIFVACWNTGPMTTTRGLLTSIEGNAMSARLTAYSLGFSMVAMFNRVAGGTYTKSADIAADIVGKGNHNLEEDDPRNVCSIADLIGDCVNDLAGNLSDLGESFVATVMSCIVIAVQNYGDHPEALALACMFPFILVTGGLIGTIISVMYIILKNRKRYKWVAIPQHVINRMIVCEQEIPMSRINPDGEKVYRVEYSPDIDDPGAELNLATTFSAIIALAISLLGAQAIFGRAALAGSFRLGWISPWFAAVLGIGSSVSVGLLTERYTSTDYKYVRRIAKISPEGASFVISEGMAVGNHSAFLPSIIIAIATVGAYILCGPYGIAVAAVGMLSSVGTTTTIDGFGPVCDNAGGIAESCGLPEEVRKITDKLDALGNTTAAVGKGNAIGAAAFSTITMLMAFIGNVPNYDLNSTDALVRMVAGGIIGMAVIREFIAILTKNTIAAAWKLADIAEDELKVPGVMEGTVQPNYIKAIEMASDNALGYMTVPSLLSVVSPIVVGFLFGPMAVFGLLLGSTYQAIGEAFFNGNAGGAYDNAKKSIEMGLVEGYGKHTPAHLATIIGDMVGDIMKDVVAVCCDISIKIMATVSVAMVLLFYYHHIF